MGRYETCQWNVGKSLNGQRESPITGDACCPTRVTGSVRSIKKGPSDYESREAKGSHFWGAAGHAYTDGYQGFTDVRVFEKRGKPIPLTGVHDKSNTGGGGEGILRALLTRVRAPVEQKIVSAKLSQELL